MIRIYTYFHRRPDFADIQIRSLRKYLQEDFELVVFNNAKFDVDKKNYNEINRVCNQLNVPVIDIEMDQGMKDFYQTYETPLGNVIFTEQGEYANPNVAVAYSLCYIWKNFISKETNKIAFLQHDMFLKEPIKFTDLLQDHQLCYIPQSRNRKDGSPIPYMWNTFFLADIPNLPEPETINWWCGSIDGVTVDVGGQTYNYLMTHPEVKYYQIEFEGFGPFGSQKIFLGDKSLIHYYRGSNWDHRSKEHHNQKTEWLLEILNL